MNIKAKEGDKPEISIIVAVNNNYPFNTIFKLLDSFFPQEGDIAYQFIVIDEKNKDKAKIYAESFPWVNLMEVKRIKRGSHPRNIALQIVQGDIIVFLEDHVTIQKDYLKNLMACFSKGHDIVGGPVINGSTQKLSNWVSYFCHYHKWFPHIKEGEIGDLPGSNFAYRTSLVKSLGPFVEEDFKLEFLLNEKARQKGNKLYFSHGLKVKHFEDVSIAGFLVHRFRYGYAFASNRKFSRLKRIIYAILSPLIAVVEFARIFMDVRKDLVYLKKFFQCAPLLLLVLFGWSFGEFIGYLKVK